MKYLYYVPFTDLLHFSALLFLLQLAALLGGAAALGR